MLSASDLITILQDQDNKSRFICYLNDSRNKLNYNLELIRSEVERLEHTIIESVKARVGESIQYVPNIRDVED